MEWISVKDELPEEMEVVIGLFEDRHCESCYRCRVSSDKYYWLYERNGEIANSPIYYIPKPPRQYIIDLDKVGDEVFNWIELECDGTVDHKAMFEAKTPEDAAKICLDRILPYLMDEMIEVE